MAGSPATVRSMSCAPNGTLYACDNGGGTTNAWKYAASAWTNFTSAAMTASDGTWTAVAG